MSKNLTLINKDIWLETIQDKKNLMVNLGDNSSHTDLILNIDELELLIDKLSDFKNKYKNKNELTFHFGYKSIVMNRNDDVLHTYNLSIISENPNTFENVNIEFDSREMKIFNNGEGNDHVFLDILKPNFESFSGKYSPDQVIGDLLIEYEYNENNLYDLHFTDMINDSYARISNISLETVKDFFEFLKNI